MRLLQRWLTRERLRASSPQQRYWILGSGLTSVHVMNRALGLTNTLLCVRQLGLKRNSTSGTYGSDELGISKDRLILLRHLWTGVHRRRWRRAPSPPGLSVVDGACRQTDFLNHSEVVGRATGAVGILPSG